MNTGVTGELTNKHTELTYQVLDHIYSQQTFWKVTCMQSDYGAARVKMLHRVL